MRKNNLILFVKIFLIFLCLKCRNSRTAIYPSLTLKEEITTGFKPERVNPYFQIYSLIKNDTLKITYINGDGNLIFFNFQSKISDVVPFQQYVKNKKIYCGIISDKKLFFYERDDMMFYKLDFSFDEKKILNPHKYDLSKVWEKYNCIDRFQKGFTFNVNKNNLYIGYQIPDRKTSYLDKYAYLKIPLIDTGNIVITKVLKYPKEFLNGKHYYQNTYLMTLNDSCFVFGFFSSDSIYKINLFTSKIVQKARVDGFGGFINYDKKQVMDLSYIRIYSTTSEFNYNIVKDILGENIIVIKHLRKEKLTDTDKWGYCILDKNLVQRFKGIFNHTINPDFCFSYKKGFLVFNQKLDKAFYYEIP